MAFKMSNKTKSVQIHPNNVKKVNEDDSDDSIDQTSPKDYSDSLRRSSVHSKSFHSIKAKTTKKILDLQSYFTFSNISKEETIRKLYDKTVINASYRQRQDTKTGKYLFSFVIKGHFEELKRKLDEIEEKYKQENLSDVQRLKKIKSCVCQKDMVGANIFHLAYLFKQYKIARYLVKRYPQWSYKQYKACPKFTNPYYNVQVVYPEIEHHQQMSSSTLLHQQNLSKKKHVLEEELNKQFQTNYENLEDLIGEENFEQEIKELGIYTGENILHILIIHRNLQEVRWLLNFYRDHIHSVRQGLPSLLKAQAIGSFFKKQSGGINFGTTPLQFAVCSNDQEIFKLVYSFCASLDDLATGKKDDDKESTHVSTVSDFGPKSIFKCDQNGNNALHLCVLHSLPDMYKCVYESAKALLIRELRKVYCKNEGVYPGHRIKDDTLFKMELNDCLSLKRDLIYMPSKEMLETWLVEEAEKIIVGDFAVALNKDLHSPLTLAASIINKKMDSPEILDKKLKMFEFLMKKLKSISWIYGPISFSAINLDGVEINYPVLEKYEIDELVYKDENYGKNLSRMLSCYIKNKVIINTAISNNQSKDIEKLKEWSEILLTKMNHMHPAISWLCINESDQAISIPEIRGIIEKKWKLMGFPFFQLSFFLHLFLCIMITLILIFINATPNQYSTYPTEIIVDILYAIVALIFFILFIQECFDIVVFETLFRVRGVARFDKTIRFLKIFSFVSFCVCKAVLLNLGQKNEEYSRNGATVLYNPEVDQAIKISMTICVMTSWIHMYYYLMGFDFSGPFVLTIMKIVMNDIPYFLNFYAIILISFGCALSMLANDGNNSPGYGFFLLLQMIWALIQSMVGFQEPTHNVNNLNPDDGSFTPRMNWIADIVMTAYYFSVGILMLNLLIALINSTYTLYSEYNQQILLIAKYNIMNSMELCMGPRELKENREKFTSVTDLDYIQDIDDISILSKTLGNIRDYLFPIVPPAKYLFQIHTENTVWWDDTCLLKDHEESYKKSNRTLQNALFIIDPQIDFHEGGSLEVSGALEDSKRIAKMIDEYGSHIHEIYVSLDSHYPKHIAHAICWKHTDYYKLNKAQKLGDAEIDKKPYDEEFRPKPFTEISHQEVLDDIWVYQSTDEKAKDWAKKYTGTLEFKSRFKLTIWPEHCIIGSNGHSVVPLINEALQRWALKSERPVVYVMKGQNIRTEMYSALSADVEDPGDASTALNEDLLIKLKTSDRLFMCGQAMSHCVNYTTRDLIDNWGSDLSNIVLLTDGASPVDNCEGLAEEFKYYCKEKGVTLTTCKDAFKGYTYDVNKLTPPNSDIDSIDNKVKLIRSELSTTKLKLKETIQKLNFNQLNEIISDLSSMISSVASKST